MKQRKDRKGFSLIISVVFVLVAVMLTMVLVTAALSTMAQVKRSKDNTQDSLLISSTAQVLAEAIQKMTFEYEYTVKEVDGKETKEFKDVRVLTPNGQTELAEEVRAMLENAGKATSHVYPEKTAITKVVWEMNESYFGGAEDKKIKAEWTVYGLDSEDFPGDIKVTVYMGNDAAKKNCVTFRIDGQSKYYKNVAVDKFVDEYYFGEVTYYAGRDIYGADKTTG